MNKQHLQADPRRVLRTRDPPLGTRWTRVNVTLRLLVNSVCHRTQSRPSAAAAAAITVVAFSCPSPADVEVNISS